MIKPDLSAVDQSKYLQLAFESCNNLSGLIDQLLEYSKLEARQIEPQKEPFHISELANDMYEKYQQQAGDQISFRIDHLCHCE